MRKYFGSVGLAVIILNSAVLAAADSGGFQMNAGIWNTDFSKSSIDPSELLQGGPPKDGIPSVDDPKFVTVEDATGWIDDQEHVVVVEHAFEVRAYPIQILIWHEIANDQIGDLPILVSFCPLCNSAVTFDRRVDGETYSFGVSGMLRNSDLVMYDRTTDSLWQQITGEAIVGEETGKRLEIVSSQVVSFGDFKKSFPEAKVMSRDTGHNRQYGFSPYGGYENTPRTIFPINSKRSLPVQPKERLLTITEGKKPKAYPFEYLRRVGVAEGKIGKTGYVVFYSPEGVSALDADRIADSKRVGAAGVFRSELDGQKLKFRRKNGKIQDKQTGSTWNVLGQAVGGPMEGKRLLPVQHGVYYAFAWLAFNPKTELAGISLAATPTGGDPSEGGFGSPAGPGPAGGDAPGGFGPQ